MEETKMEESSEQIRIQLKLSPLVKNKEYELSPTLKNTEIAVPSSIRRKGLSLLVNHLLEEEDEKTSFDFLVNNKLLRTSLEIAGRRDMVTFEECIVIEYFPSYNTPCEEYTSEVLPDWISEMSYCDILVCGCYDGSIKILDDEWCSYSVHDSGIKCVDTIKDGDGVIVATGGLDHVVKSHVYTKDGLDSHVEYVNGHCNTIESVALSNKLLASGDYDGTLCLWDYHDTITPSKKSKLQTKSKQSKSQVEPVVCLQAHTTSISGISFSNITNHMITSSHDYSLKVWDIEQQDCLVTLNGLRVITSFDIATNADIVVTTHPDCTVRLWDVKSVSNTSFKDTTTFKPSHKGYVSDVQWSPTNPFLFATASYDGTCKLWDIRGTLPLFTFNCNDEKVLCLAFGDCNERHQVYCAGTDCVVKKFSF